MGDNQPNDEQLISSQSITEQSAKGRLNGEHQDDGQSSAAQLNDTQSCSDQTNTEPLHNGQPCNDKPCNGQRTYNTFIFDLDGTLLDTLPDLVVLTNKALGLVGFPPRSREEIHHFVGNGVRALIYQAVPEGTKPEDADKALAQWKNLHVHYDNHLTHAYPYIEETLDQLRKQGCKLAVLSNKFDEGVHQIIDLRLPGKFDAMHGEAPGFPRKPDPTGLLNTIKELGSTPDQTVYVGDSPGDVRTARNAGVYSVAVTWGYHPRKDFETPEGKPDLLIDDPRDLLKLASCNSNSKTNSKA